MKRLMLLCLIGAFLMTSAVVSAQEKAPLGVGNLALKVDYIEFTEDDLDDPFDVDSGLYLGIEGYGEISPNWYLGGEVGWTNPDGDVLGVFDTELTYIPVEINLKYAVEVSPQFIIDFGAGVSYNYAEIEVDVKTGHEEDASIDGGLSDSEDEWLLGGQFFVDLNYTFDKFFLGINGKYQITEEWEDELKLSNWRIGGQIGFFF